ncbi:MAG: hypothetical protein ACE5IK_08810 [Acidobacteriota bacterium]
MLRALFWKEWREQRSVRIAAATLALLLPLVLVLSGWISTGSAGLDPGAIAMNINMVYAGLIWPLTALLAGAAALAEFRAPTLPFLFTRPVSRLTAGLDTIGAGRACRLMVVAVSGGAGRLLLMATGRDAPRAMNIPVLGDILAGQTDVAALACALFLLFACAVLFSTLMVQTLLAAGAAMAAATGIIILAVAVQVRMMFLVAVGRSWLLADLALLALLMLLVSMLVFSRGELRAGAGRRTGRALVGVTLAVAVACLAVPALFALPRLDPDDARVVRAVPAPGGTTVALVVTSATRRGSWMLVVDPASPGGSGSPVRAAGLGAGSPAFTADGDWLVYLTTDWVSMTVSIRAVHPDGTADHEVLGHLTGPGWFVADALSVSPDGTMVALTRGWVLAVGALTPDRTSTMLDLRAMPKEQARVVGWTPDSSEIILLFNPTSPATPETTGRTSRLEAFDITTHERRVIRVLSAYSSVSTRWQPAAGIETVPVIESPESPWKTGPRPFNEKQFTLSLVDVMSGLDQRISSTACWAESVSLSADGRRLAWVECPSDAAWQAVRLRFAPTGEEQEVYRLEGHIPTVDLSPAGDRLLLWTCPRATTTCPVDIVSIDGSRSPVAGDWRPVGWTDQAGALLASREYPANRLVVVGGTGGRPRILFP